ncbi:PQQ-binding-like beta-propeller repeat protein [Deinococcus lacus]|uniref:PQQ-binding-like beta-propeller repeat protein n=1 Tax=Deinococcus lacus TaxID=392561 RepID=A0ABW1YC52_9DEIO
MSNKTRLTWLYGLFAASLTLTPAIAAPQPDWTKALPALSSVSLDESGDLAFIGNDAAIYRVAPDGTVRWQYKVGDIGRAQPVFAEGRLYAASYDDSVYALDSGGQLLWSTRLDGDVFSSPALLPGGDLIVATAAGSIYRLDAQTGQVAWQYSASAPVYSSPAVGPGGSIFVGNQAGQLTSLSDSGTLRWTFQAGASIFSSPALDAENVYFGSSDRQVYSLTQAGELRWKQPTGLFVNASPVLTAAGQVVVGSYDGRLYAFDRAGTPLWQYVAGAPIAAAAAELADGTLLVGDLGGTLHAVSPEGQPVWILPTGKKIDTAAAVSDQGRVYVSSEGSQVTLLSGLPPLSSGDWPAFRQVPSGLGRTPSAAEAQARLAARAPAQQAARPTPQPEPAPALASAAEAQGTPGPAAAPSLPAETADVPVLSVLDIPVTPLPSAATSAATPAAAPEPLSPAAQQLAAGLYRAGEELWLPLDALTEAYGLKIWLLSPRSVTVQLPAGPQKLAGFGIRKLEGVTYVPLSELEAFSGAQVERTAESLSLSLGGTALKLPLEQSAPASP